MNQQIALPPDEAMRRNLNMQRMAMVQQLRLNLASANMAALLPGFLAIGVENARDEANLTNSDPMDHLGINLTACANLAVRAAEELMGAMGILGEQPEQPKPPSFDLE